MQSDRSSSLKNLVLVTGHMFFTTNLRKRAQKNTSYVTEDTLTVNKYNEALLMWIKKDRFDQSNNITALNRTISNHPTKAKALYSVGYLKRARGEHAPRHRNSIGKDKN